MAANVVGHSTNSANRIRRENRLLSVWWNQLRMRMRMLWGRRQLERDLQDELDFHLALGEQRRRESGMPAEQAQQLARYQLGNPELIKESCRELWTWTSLETLWQDICYGSRMLRKDLSFTLIALLTLSLGIGANTAIFSLVDFALLNPLPYPKADQLVVFHEQIRREGYQRDQEMVTPGDFSEWKTRNTAFEDVAAIANRSFDLTGTGEPVQIEGEAISSTLFPILQVSPALGRIFQPEEDESGAGKVAIIGYGLWASRFAADRHVVGRSILLNGANYVIVGVMPKGFSFPDPDDQLWVPLALSPQEWMSRAAHSLRVVGRLRAGVSLAETQIQIDSLCLQIAAEYPDTNAGLSARLISLREATVGNVRPALLILWLCTALVLLIVCVNLASLLFTQASIRRREFAVRLALGASRRRIVRQLITESLLLSLVAGAAGLLFAIWGMHALRGISPPPSFPYIPRIEEIGINRTLLLFVLLLSVIAGIMFSVIPALRTGGCDLQKKLREEDTRGSSAGSRRWVRSVLVISQTALGVVVMIIAGLLLRSFNRLGSLPIGFERQHVLTVRVLARGVQYPDFPRRLSFYQQVLSKIQSLPGVESAGAVSFLPLTRIRQFNTISIEGRPVTSTAWSPSADIRVATPGYAEALRVGMVSGRSFSWEEDSPESAPVVIVSQEFAQDLFPSGDAIGSHIKIGNPQLANPWRIIVGVVNDVPYFDIASPVQPTVYVPYAQAASLAIDVHDLAVRTKQDPASVAAAVRNAIWSVDGGLAVSRVRTMNDVYSIAVAPQRFNALLLALMAALVVLLAAIGLYGVTAYSVVQRTHEIGVRLSLGASPADVLRLVLVHSGALVLSGAVAGMIASFLLKSLITNLLFNLSAVDPTTYGAVVGLLGLVAAIACYGPARAAARIDPITALRYE